MLRWHYRSRHPSLIEVSNAEFYQHLVMPPAPETDRTGKGLILHHVQGAYDTACKISGTPRCTFAPARNKFSVMTIR
jgi:hypothetical protein